MHKIRAKTRDEQIKSNNSTGNAILLICFLARVHMHFIFVSLSQLWFMYSLRSDFLYLSLKHVLHFLNKQLEIVSSRFALYALRIVSLAFDIRIAVSSIISFLYKLNIVNKLITVIETIVLF